MTPFAATRLRLALLTLAFVCTIALTGVIVTKPHGFLDGAVPLTGVLQQAKPPRQ
jgi:hypothetical protein